MRRIGVLMSADENDPVQKTSGLHQLKRGVAILREH
jgi:hypothetical protein